MISITFLPQTTQIQIIKDCEKDPKSSCSIQAIKDICENITYDESNACVLKMIFDNKNFYPLHDANKYLENCSGNGLTELVSILLKNVASDKCFDKTVSWAIFPAINGKHIDTLKILLNDERALSYGCESKGLVRASVMGATEIVKLLLTNPKINPSAYNNEPIRYAAKNNHTEVVKLLLPRIDIKLIDRDDEIDIRIRQLYQEFNSSKGNIKELLKQLIDEMKKENITNISIDRNKILINFS